MNAEFSNADGTTTVTVSHDGLGSTGGWSLTIAGQELHGDDTDRSAAEAALWNVPEGGGIAAVEVCGSIRVPHRRQDTWRRSRSRAWRWCRGVTA